MADREQIIALAKRYDLLYAFREASIDAFYHAAIQQYKDSILADVGELVTKIRDIVRHHDILNEVLEADLVACLSDQLIAACKSRDEEIERLKAHIAQCPEAFSSYTVSTLEDAGLKVPTPLQYAMQIRKRFAKAIEDLNHQLAAAQEEIERLKTEIKEHEEGWELEQGQDEDKNNGL